MDTQAYDRNDRVFSTERRRTLQSEHFSMRYGDGAKFRGWLAASTSLPGKRAGLIVCTTSPEIHPAPLFCASTLHGNLEGHHNPRGEELGRREVRGICCSAWFSFSVSALLSFFFSSSSFLTRRPLIGKTPLRMPLCPSASATTVSLRSEVVCSFLHPLRGSGRTCSLRYCRHVSRLRGRVKGRTQGVRNEYQPSFGLLEPWFLQCE
ncbi:hypothetical protein LZ32DRAFT_368399 [Colletotrichum eremochloae]|nr:hypothetical protein LZ32DRAFT_368399 [Colletotrichum eremochloae]